MKGSAISADGKFLAYGLKDSAHIAKHIAAGGAFVPGASLGPVKDKSAKRLLKSAANAEKRGAKAKFLEIVASGNYSPERLDELFKLLVKII